MNKKYSDVEKYERKLGNVMKRIGADRYDYDHGRKFAYIEFLYHGRGYRFESTTEELQERGINLNYGSDVFSMLVLDLECIARMMEHGTYDIESGEIKGLKQLGAGVQIPECFKVLHFDRIPDDVSEVKKQFRRLAKVAHPDAGGSESEFVVLQEARKAAIEYMEERES